MENDELLARKSQDISKLQVQEWQGPCKNVELLAQNSQGLSDNDSYWFKIRNVSEKMMTSCHENSLGLRENDALLPPKIANSKQKWRAIGQQIEKSKLPRSKLKARTALKSKGLSENKKQLTHKLKGLSENYKVLAQKSQGRSENNKHLVQSSHGLSKNEELLTQNSNGLS